MKFTLQKVFLCLKLVVLTSLMMTSCRKKDDPIDPVAGIYYGKVVKGSSGEFFNELPDELVNAKIELIDISRMSSNTNSDIALRGLSGYKYELIITNTSTNKRFLYNIGLDRNASNLSGRYQEIGRTDYSDLKFSFQPIGTVNGNKITISLNGESFSDGTLKEFYQVQASK